MRIKSLKAAGFKSFCNPIEINFQQNGITVIVGPNGCGKSNVVDAIRWVLGEQRVKHLRGGAMEDVIFAGSEFQKPLGMAEVTLTFSNTEGDILPKYQEYTEIAVTRKLYRSGESAYLLNKTPVRLKDIRELFMDTGVGSNGYSIIEQGRVGEIVSAKPQDRRLLIEDAAGIVKFQTKRLSAEKRIEETEQNLHRVVDVLQELNRQEEALRDQVEKAKTYIEVRDKSQLVDRQLSTLRWKNAWDREQEAAQSIEQYKARQLELQNQKAIQETDLERLELEQLQREKQLDALKEAIFQKEREIQEAENERALEKQNLGNYQEWIKKHDQELEELNSKLKGLAQAQETAEHKVNELSKQHQKLQNKVQEIDDSKHEEETILRDLTEELREFQSRLLKIHTQITNQTNQKHFLEERLENLQERQELLKEQERSSQKMSEAANLKLQESQGKVGETQSCLDGIKAEVKKLLQQNVELSQLMEQKAKRVQEAQYQYHTTLSHLESLEKIQTQYEDFSDSIKQLIQHFHEVPEDKDRLGVLGLLADFITISSENIPKVTPVMTECLEWVIVKNSSFLQEIEFFLKAKGWGQLTFVAVNPVLQTATVPHSGQALSDFIQFAPVIHNWASSLFKNIIYTTEPNHLWTKVLSNNEEASFPLEWVSEQGTYVTHHKTAKIGKIQSASFGFIERQNQIESLKHKTSLLLEQCEILEQNLTQLQTQKHAHESKIQQQQSFQHETELSLLSSQKEQEHHHLELKRAQQLRQQLQSEVNGLQNEIANTRQKQEQTLEMLQAHEQERVQLEHETDRHHEKIEIQKRNVEEFSEELLTHRVGLTEAFEQLKSTQHTSHRLKQEILEGQSRLKLLEKSHQEYQAEILQSQKIIENCANKFSLLIQERAQLKNLYQEQSGVYTAVHQEHSELNTHLKKAQHALDEAQKHLHEEELKVTEQRLQRVQQEEQLLQTYAQTPQDLLKEIDLEPLKESELAGKLRVLRAKLNTMANVNLTAPEEYEALTERITFLTQQSDDLNKAIKDLEVTIREINAESRRRFKEMFELVNKNFQSVFTTLFGGGEARMILTESSDVLEAGIDIVAQPPGKKLQNINLLSGGEKALTAISLIFAIFINKPSPFCLLDEVDAPLDDANVAKFNRMIQQMTSDSQFIVITHNKKTMEIGNLLYGITMEEPGVSKTVSVEFEEAVAEPSSKK
ncbi:chromosome segregation protein SMC [Deltaproteobacteria bacterium TL4]